MYNPKKYIKSVLSLFVQQLIIVFNYGRHDTQHNGTQHNDIKHNNK